MRRILYVLIIFTAEAELPEHRSVDPLLNPIDFNGPEPKIVNRIGSSDWIKNSGSQAGVSEQQKHEKVKVTHNLMDSTDDHLSISSTWQHHGRGFYLTHSIQQHGHVIDGGVEDLGEEIDQNIPYNRGLPGDAFADLTFGSGASSTRSIPVDLWRNFMMNLSTSFIAGVLYFVLIFTAGVIYKVYKENPMSPPQDGEEHSQEALDRRKWRFGLCTCFSNPRICCISFCCPAVRWADTIEMSGLMAFWLGLTVCALLISMSEATFGLTYLLFLLMATHGRQQIRALFGIPGHSCYYVVEDFCTYLCCCCCAVTQEARQLDEAYAVGHPVVKVPGIDLEAPPQMGSPQIPPPHMASPQFGSLGSSQGGASPQMGSLGPNQGRASPQMGSLGSNQGRASPQMGSLGPSQGVMGRILAR